MPSNYKINKSNQNYINALVKYCADEPIYSVNYVSNDDYLSRDLSRKNLTCKDLPSLLPTIGSNEFSMACGSSARSILPKVDAQKLLAAIPEVSNEEISLITDNNIFKGYFEWVVECALTHHETYRSTEGSSKQLATLRPNLSKTEAILLLQQIDEVVKTADKSERVSQYLKGWSAEKLQKAMQSMKIANTLLLPQHETFVFCIAGEAYYLRYGKQPKFDTINGFAFDMDDGFMVSRWPEDVAEKTAFIMEELNARFNRWKNNNYKGDFISQDESGLEASIAPTVVSSSGMFAQINNQPHHEEKQVNRFKY